MSSLLPVGFGEVQGRVLAGLVEGFSFGKAARRLEGSGDSVHSIPSLKLNIEPENGWLEEYFPFEKAYFQGLS